MLRILYCIVYLLGVHICWAQHKIQINEGQKYTNNTVIDVHLFHPNATAMKLCNGLAMESESWKDFNKKATLTLPAGDGKKVVSVRFKEADGKITEQFIASIILDTNPPQSPKLVIGNDSLTRIRTRNQLTLSANGAHFMKISNVASFDGARWLPYDSTFLWDLQTGDGEKTVYAQFKDQIGNESETVNAKIILDSTPPKNTAVKITTERGIITARDSIIYTNDTTKIVDLILQAEEAKEMMISNRHTFYGAVWEPYQSNRKNWTLQKEGADGEHIVYVQFRDKAGNISKKVQDKIIVDTHPPIDMKFLLNENSPITNDENIKLTIFARGCHFMKISETKDFANAAWEPYQIVKNWKLSGDDGMRRVYIIYKDSANNETKVVTDGILLDRKKPYDLQMILESGTKRIRGSSITVELIAKEANQMQISLNPNFKGANWLAYDPAPFQLKFTEARGTRKVYARFRDEAGNITETISDEVILEEVPLNCKAVINQNDEFASDAEGVVNLTLFATHAKQMMVSNRADFRRAVWEPYRTTMVWPLAEGDGIRTVYVKYKSATDTESAVVYDKIIVDRRGPFDTEILINNGDNSTFEPILMVEVKAQDAILMQLSTSPDFKGVLWKNYSSQPQHIKASERGGIQRVYARFQDIAGNVSNPVVDEILYEIVPLDNAVTINNNNIFCTSKDRKAILTLRSQNATEMLIANQKDFAGSIWEPYDSYKLWDLGGEDGFKRVFVKFRSHTKTESEVVTSSIILDRLPPQNPKMWLSKTRAGIAINPSLLYVSVTAEDAAMMQISNSAEFSSKHWTWSQYTDLSFIHEIGVQQGEVSVWVRFKDEAGNVSVPVSKRILVDQRPPKGNSVKIKTTSPYINTNEVVLDLHSSDAVEMRLGSSPNLENMEWQPFQESINWTFTGEDGIKHVYVQFKDKTNNISKPVSDDIEVDREGPTYGKVEIVDDYCIDPFRTVHLKLATEGATQMMISNEPTFDSAVWQRVKPEVHQWRLKDEDGIRTVYVKFADEAGNETKVYTDNILLDRQAPIGSITFNDGAAYANNPNGQLTIQYGDAIKMIISQSPTFDAPAAWEEVKDEKAWKLIEFEGKQIIYMKLLDRAGNISTLFVDSILMDTEAPIVRSVKINDGMSAVKTNKPVTINSKVFGAKFMMISNLPDMTGAEWVPYFANKEWNLDPEEGLKTVYVKFKDEYGNETQVFSDNIQTYNKLYQISK